MRRSSRVGSVRPCVVVAACLTAGLFGPLAFGPSHCAAQTGIAAPRGAGSAAIPGAPEAYLLQGPVPRSGAEEGSASESTERPSIDALAPQVEPGTSAREARQRALEDLPLEKMDAAAARRALSLCRSAGMFRQLPAIRVEADADVYDFFVQCPDVAVGIWHVLDISDFRMWQTGRHEYEADDGQGTVGLVDVLLRGRDENVILCEGSYRSPLLPKPIQARALMHLRTHRAEGPAGRTRFTHRLTLFVDFPSQAVDTAAKLVSPVSNVIIDRNFREVSLFLHMMSVAMVRQPGWVEQVSRKLETVPAFRRDQFLRLAAHVYAAGRRNGLVLEDPPVEPVLDAYRQSAAPGRPAGEGTAHVAAPESPAPVGLRTAPAQGNPAPQPNRAPLVIAPARP